MKHRIPRVALLIETSRSYGRGVLKGVVRCARLHGPWSFYITPGDFAHALPEMKQWGGSGIIARIESERTARAIQPTGLPTVGLDLPPHRLAPGIGRRRISEMHPDPVASVNMAIYHLLERRFQRFAFVEVANRIWSAQLEAAFADHMAEDGCEHFIYRSPLARREREWSREQDLMARWLRSLPVPIGLVTCNDDRGRQVLEAALAAGVQVPYEIAVIGIYDDDLLADMSIYRRSLELRCFRKTLGRSLHEELSNVRLEQVKRLPAETDLTTKRIARKTRFGGGSYMGQVFRKVLGQTPTQFLRHVRSR